MKLFENFYCLQHPWPTVTLANWNKYPNPLSSHVVSCDVLSRQVSQDGILTTERLLCCKQPVPSLLKRLGLGFSDLAYFHEVSTLNLKTQEFTAQTVNLSMRSLLDVSETCVLSVDPSSVSSGRTLFKQQAQVSAMGVLSSFGRLVEDLAVNRFIANAAKGKDALELVTSRIWSEAMDFENKMEQRVSDSIDHFKGELEELTQTVTQSGLDLVRSSLEQGSPFL